MKKLKILELTNYSAGGCGVFARVRQESIELSNLGHEVRIFSSNFEKGTDKIVGPEDLVEGIKISRFPAVKLGGESFMRWFDGDAEKQALEFSPEIIIAHAYRHPHTKKAVDLAKKIGAKVFLVTHAPFDRAEFRYPLANLSVFLYDNLVGRNLLRKFDKVIAITHWEIPHLASLSVPQDKIAYVPNGVRKEFLTKIKSTKKSGILYTGRVAPIKNLQVLIKAISSMNSESARLVIYGPAEKEYLDNLVDLVQENHLTDKIEIVDKTYSSEEQIRKLDSSSIFVLPSISEGMPQVLIEAMARGLVVVASDNLGNRDLILHGKNGFLFKSGDELDLAARLNSILFSKNLSSIRKNARKFAEQFAWPQIAKKLEKVISS